MNYLEQADQDLRDAEEADRKRQLIAGIGQALAAAASARGLARVGKSPDLSQFQNISEASSRALSDAVTRRRKAQAEEQDATKQKEDARAQAIANAAKERAAALEKQSDREARAEEKAQDRAFQKAQQEASLRQQKELAEASRGLEKEKLAAQAKPAEVKLSPQETSRQRTVGEEVGNYQTKGGRKAVEDSLAKLESIATKLEDPKNSRLTGTIVDKAAAILGAQDLRDTLAPDQLALKQQVKDAVLPGLKAMFPGATSDTELKTFMELTWDDRLSPKENAAKIRARLPQLRSRMESLEALSGSPTTSVAPSVYPKTVRKGNQSATVSNSSEEEEARSEGWQ